MHTDWEAGELDLSIGVRSGLQIEPPHPTKSILDVNFDGGCIDGLAVRAPYCKFNETGTSTAVYGWNFFAGHWRLSPRKQRDGDQNGTRNTKQSVHIRTIIRAQQFNNSRPYESDIGGRMAPMIGIPTLSILFSITEIVGDEFSASRN